uniref:Uncharacterized protein n=1 Tax=Arundo donax TaxID=35708 RepID=A0A0A9GI93_ARUDO
MKPSSSCKPLQSVKLEQVMSKTNERFAGTSRKH